MMHPTAHTAGGRPCQALRRTLLLATLLLGGTALHAQTFTDATFESLYTSERHVELERSATTRLASKPDDGQAVLALALTALNSSPANLGVGRDEATRRKAAMASAEACVEKNAKAAECHYALGVLLGVQAMSEGMLKAATSVGRVRGALQEAHSLLPGWYAARSALMEFHLQAPGLAGGSRAKAAELAKTAPMPAQAKVLQARVLATDDKEEQALRAFTDHKSGADSAVDEDVRGWGNAAAFGLLNKAAAQSLADRAQSLAVAHAWFERARQERPEASTAVYGLARSLAEAGQHAEALAHYERSAKLKGADILPIDYRSAISLQALGRKDAARAALQRFVSTGKGSKRALDDAKKRLEQLAA